MHVFIVFQACFSFLVSVSALHVPVVSQPGLYSLYGNLSSRHQATEPVG